MTEEEKIICKQFLNDADKTHSCNEYKLLMALLEQEPTTKNDLGVNAVSRKEVDRLACRYLKEPTDNHVAFYEHFLDLPSVTSQEPILDKIRAEIAKCGSIMVAYAITKDTKTDKGIEKLVRDVLQQAKEEVLDIIDKYKGESDKE